jgi:hypothetical protein
MPVLDNEHASGMDVLPHGSDLRPSRAEVQSVNKQVGGMDFGWENPESHNHLCSSEDAFFQSFVTHLGMPISASAAELIY